MRKAKKKNKRIELRDLFVVLASISVSLALLLNFQSSDLLTKADESQLKYTLLYNEYRTDQLAMIQNEILYQHTRDSTYSSFVDIADRQALGNLVEANGYMTESIEYRIKARGKSNTELILIILTIVFNMVALLNPKITRRLKVKKA